VKAASSFSACFSAACFALQFDDGELQARPTANAVCKLMQWQQLNGTAQQQGQASPLGAEGDILGEEVAIEAAHVTDLLCCIVLVPLVPAATGKHACNPTVCNCT
jgi:hypothetical protein